ncbi:MAG: 1-deoxy-D-xylulose-5-phosphate synthase [Magnetovibrio sp.]|nr:1-deoxy-D-xylulose-5-phosphate synthase [Magnetovibrio sp.]
MSSLIDQVSAEGGIQSLTREQLPALADEIRDFLIHSVCRTGGHLGVNTGIVEVTIAMHYVFDSPKDKFVWDVGHQVYVHKILTGRAHTLKTMRQDGGSPGFPAKDESEHDLMDVSHGGTSLSVASGIALANKIKGTDGYPIAIIGDSALGEGLALEALNQIGYDKPKMLMIVNDNGWGITENKTALKAHLASKTEMMSNQDGLFEAMGLKYVGPVDGHDLDALIDVLEEVKDEPGPVALHVKTEKGRGVPFPTDDITKYHFCFPLNTETGKPITEDIGTEEGVFYKPLSSFNAALVGAKIKEIAESDDDIALITPATMGASETLGAFNAVPDRAFDVGMAEQHALTLGVGLSLQGMKPIISYQSTFFQRAYDQLVHDACVNNVPLLIILARSGLAGLDHATHHAVLDLSYLSCVPNLEIYFPPDHKSFNALLEDKARNWVSGPTILMNPYGTLEMIEPSDEELQSMVDNLYNADNVGVILTTAGFLKSALKVQAKLQEAGAKWAVLNVTKIAPLDQDLFAKLFGQYDRFVTMEENVSRGGMGSSVLEIANDMGKPIEALRITLGDKFVDHGTRPYLHAQCDIGADNVVAKVKAKWPDLKS